MLDFLQKIRIHIIMVELLTTVIWQYTTVKRIEVFSSNN